MSESVLNIAFYHFFDPTPLDALRVELTELCEARDLRGSIILSYEGINGMIAGEPEDVEALAGVLNSARPALAKMPIKRSWSDEVPFDRLVVKVKPEIVTMRVPDVDPLARTGEHLPPEVFRDWLRGGEEMVLVDVRNDFECKLGTFRGALNPETRAFHEFPDVVRAHREAWQERKVVMFCTGGIRCEKATSWMLDEGFEQVYQLEGGILNYFERVEDADRDWLGELYVFDKRVALDTRLGETATELADLDE